MKKSSENKQMYLVQDDTDNMDLAKLCRKGIYTVKMMQDWGFTQSEIDYYFGTEVNEQTENFTQV
ncbi:hypothetical protein KBI51_03385 [Aerococcaceae bacterium zg-ZUI334]|uniref:hypothetical protein n=1 Tax=Aerococcaceae TaxID=186827 RepID=UPI0013BA1FFD|nr:MULTISPECIES: hypothetical protein [unclassified Facklamia]MBR7927217.1 hypothetical protein [Aerococcaceae bacterium zg-ZUI334]MBS4462606.1 hypothetical protein [Aerococcaceae bacterium zg-B36]QQD66269.1 hypothetical protein JDW14_04000 [Aerococcaceae bacterium zg-252]NEW63720.1 hypothetical protein [Facklamia sp. 252]NEW67191.1 hypothetical protein [Facklamia sp. 253]